MVNVQSKNCPQCGAPIEAMAPMCKFCGAELVISSSNPPTQSPQAPPITQTPYAPAPQYQAAQNPTPQYQPPQYNAAQRSPAYAPAYASDPEIYKKSKTTAGILAIILGGIGVHKFYLGKIGKGILYLIFCWTYIPAIIGFIEGIIYLTSSDEKFYTKYVRG